MGWVGGDLMPNKHSGLCQNKHSLCACLEFQGVHCVYFCVAYTQALSLCLFSCVHCVYFCVAYTQALSLCLFSCVGVRSWGTPIRSPWTWWWLSSFVHDHRKINTASVLVCKPGPPPHTTPPLASVLLLEALRWTFAEFVSKIVKSEELVQLYSDRRLTQQARGLL